jgi:hypothetical protein
LLQDPNQNTVDSSNNVRRETGRHFSSKNREYVKAKIGELETDSKTKNITDMYRGKKGFKEGYQPRNNIVKDEKCDLVTDSHSILSRWRNNFSHLLNVHGVNDLSQTEILTAETLVPEPSAFGVERASEMLKKTNQQVMANFQQI